MPPVLFWKVERFSSQCAWRSCTKKGQAILKKKLGAASFLQAATCCCRHSGGSRARVGIQEIPIRDGQIDPNIDSIDTKVSIGIGSILAWWHWYFCCSFPYISSANHSDFFTEFVWLQRLSQSWCAALLSTSLTQLTQVHSDLHPLSVVDHCMKSVTQK